MINTTSTTIQSSEVSNMNTTSVEPASSPVESLVKALYTLDIFYPLNLLSSLLAIISPLYIYFVDNSIRSKTSLFAGSSKGFVDGIVANAEFNCPLGMCVNPNDNCLYVCDNINHAIRRISVQGLLFSCFFFLSI